MKRKKIQYNELSEEIYADKYWTPLKLIAVSCIVIFLGFISNFSLETKITKWVTSTLLTNEACPVNFDKIELTYFFPAIIITNPVIQGTCFGQVNNKLPLQNIKISLSFPSFYPLGLKLSTIIKASNTAIHLYPILSPFSQYLEIKNSQIDSRIFSAMSSDNVSPIGGMISVEGFLKLVSGNLEDGQLTIKSSQFYLPTQNIKGFEMKMMSLKHLNIQTHFSDKSVMQIDHIEIGKAGMPINLKLRGSLRINQRTFSTSLLQLTGALQLSSDVLTNFPFLKLFLPATNTSGNYQMNLNGPLNNLGPPQFN